MKAAIYARVSTTDQTTDNQTLELERAAERQGLNRPQFSRHSPAALRTAPHTLPARAGY